MRFILFTLFLPLISVANNHSEKSKEVFFLENKGQITDQFRSPRKDINFSVPANGMTVFIGQGTMHYQFYQPITRKNADTIALVNSYRLDVSLVGANTNAGMITEDILPYDEYYHTAAAEGIVHAYKKITYRNIYPGIDWVVKSQGREMKYEFIVHPGADPSLISLRFDGASSLNINNDGSFTATTPMGSISEHAPDCFGEDGKKVNSSFKLTGNVLSFAVEAYAGTLTIDPTLEWATYYGDQVGDAAHATVTDIHGNVYMAGNCVSIANIATSGAHQEIFGGWSDGFLAKFNRAGIRQWGTFFGGTEEDYSTSLATDDHANIYMTGMTRSTSAIASFGTHRQTFGGGDVGYGDAFLVKFDSAGSYQWGTYFGGEDGDVGTSIALDNWDNIYLSGVTKSDTGIATPGAHKVIKDSGYDVFIAKFNATGNRIWSTYYGADGDDNGAIAVDGPGNIYLGGTNSSMTNIATPGSHQPAFAGDFDGMLIKFDSAGTRQWGTYYGGNGADGISAITIDDADRIYIAGSSRSNFNIATPGSHKPVRGLMDDGFIACFNTDGIRQWGTYYGGDEADYISAITSDNNGHIYIGGNTKSDTGIATSDAYMDIYQGGGADCFWSVFDQTGIRLYGTYYGGESTERVSGIAVDDSANVYLAGRTGSLDIGTTNGHQPLYPTGAVYTALLARFSSYDLLSVYNLASSTVSNSFRLYPNPNEGAFVLSGNVKSSGAIVTIRVTDITGKIVYSDNFISADKTINKRLQLQHLPPQAYLLSISSGKEVENITFIKH